MENVYSSRQEVFYELPQGTIFILNTHDITNYADDNTPYVARTIMDNIFMFQR